MSSIYETTVRAAGGRDGKVVSEDGVLSFEVRIPKSMGGPGGEYTNPEQLFAAGYAACFDSALNMVARTKKLKISSEVAATVGLQTPEPANFQLVVDLSVKVDGVDRETAQQLLQAAHEVCPYSKAIRNNVEVTVHLAE